MDCAKLMEFLNENDRFCKGCGIRLTRVEPGYAEAELLVSDRVLNGRNFVQGGAIVTLADFAFAGAANAMGSSAVSLNCNANFIRPGTGERLTAVARKVHHGGKTAIYAVEVFNGDGKLAATVSVTGFIIDDKPIAG